MRDEGIRQVGRASGGEALESAPARQGLFWLDTRRIATDTHYQPNLPEGLHLGCGIARLSTRGVTGGAAGGFTLDGPGITAVLARPGEDRFDTILAAGDMLSCGLFLGADAAAADPRLAEIAALLGRGALARGSGQVPPHLVMRLCAPIDPWFQGTAREMAMEARVLELTAMVWMWLAGKAEMQGAAPRQALLAERARDMLETTLADPPTLAQLARQLGSNVRGLTACFRARFGCSIAAYVTRRRLEQAADLLRQGMAASTAAYRVGYTPQHFSTAFQRQFGLTPKQYAASPMASMPGRIS